MGLKQIEMQDTFFPDMDQRTGLFIGNSLSDKDQTIVDVSILNTQKQDKKKLDRMAGAASDTIMKRLENRLGPQSAILSNFHDNRFFQQWLSENLDTEEGVTQKKINALVKKMEINNNIFAGKWYDDEDNYMSVVSSEVWNGINDFQTGNSVDFTKQRTKSNGFNKKK